MKNIQISVVLTDELGIKSVAFDHNDTGLPCTSETLGNVAIGILKAIGLNKNSLIIQDLLNELDIETKQD